GSFGTNLHNDLTNLQGSIDSALNTASQVPFLNQERGKIAEGKAFADNLLTGLKNVFDTTQDTGTIATDLFTLLNPTTGIIPLLAKHDGTAGTPTSSDIIVTPLAGGGFETDMRLHLDLIDSKLPLGMSLGLPGIPFDVKTSGNVHIQVGFDYELAVVYNPANTDTFSLDDSKVLLGSDSFDGHQMSLHTTASLSDPGQCSSSAFSATVILGFLEG